MEKEILEVCLKGNCADTPGGVLHLGCAKSYGIYRLHITADEAWQGLAIAATFDCGSANAVTAIPDADGLLDVPAEATASATTTQPGVVTFSGTDGAAVRRVSAKLLYRVQPTGSISGGNAVPPAPTVTEQLQAQVGAVTAAEETRQQAEAAREEAENARATAENSRAAAESSRKSAESARATAEGARATAETKRQTDTQAAIRETEAAAEAANNAAKRAEDALENQEQLEQTLAQCQELKNQAAQEAKNAATEADAAEAAKNQAGQAAANADKSAGQVAVAVMEHNQSAEAHAELFAAITPDDTVVSGKPWTSKKIVDSLCQTFAETGNPVQCYPVENYPIGVKVSWEPVQDGSGDPSPENIRPITGRDSVTVERCGENLLDKARFPIIKSKNNILVDSEITLPAGTYTVCVLSVASGVYANGADVRCTYNSNKHTFTLARQTAIRLSAYWTKGRPEKDENIWLIEGNEWRTYTPYIGKTNTLTLPETVYGGTLDVESGVVTVEYGHIASYAGDALPGEWISDRDVYSSGAVPTTGAQVVYKLAEPITIQFDPHQISALSGVNTIYTDADGVIVTGAEDPKHTITELKNAIISLGGNV